MKKLLLISIVIAFFSMTISVVYGGLLEQLWVGIKTAVETGVGDKYLPPGASDVVNVLKASPDVTKIGLIRHLDAKIVEATLDGDIHRRNKYQAYKTSILTGDPKYVKDLERPSTTTTTSSSTSTTSTSSTTSSTSSTTTTIPPSPTTTSTTSTTTSTSSTTTVPPSSTTSSSTSTTSTTTSSTSSTTTTIPPSPTTTSTTSTSSTTSSTTTTIPPSPTTSSSTSMTSTTTTSSTTSTTTTQPRKPFTAEFDCGTAFELSPNDALYPRICHVLVSNYGGSDNRVEVIVGYDNRMIDVFPQHQSAAPFNMFPNANGQYIFSINFSARVTAPEGLTAVVVTVKQGASSIAFPLTISILPPGVEPSGGLGIRPPANVATGSGGEFCVWRYKMFGDPPPCFHFVKAKCDSPRYNNKPKYELVGANMTWAEGSARMGQLSSYFDDAYGCRGGGSVTTTPTTTITTTTIPTTTTSSTTPTTSSTTSSTTTTTTTSSTTSSTTTTTTSSTTSSTSTTTTSSSTTSSTSTTTTISSTTTTTLGGGWLTSPRDTDGDGVSDDKDNCPGTPPKRQVDASGCAVDPFAGDADEDLITAQTDRETGHQDRRRDQEVGDDAAQRTKGPDSSDQLDDDLDQTQDTVTPPDDPHGPTCKDDDECVKKHGKGFVCENGKCVKKDGSKPKSLAVNPANKAIGINESLALKSILKKDDGSTEDVTKSTTWNPGNPFSKDQIGEYTVTATYKDLKGSAKITVVKDKGLDDISVNSKTITVSFFDHGVEDGDIIDILVNGKVLYPGIVLTKAPQSRTITLTADIIVFAVRAVNTGRVGKNTATVTFSNVTKGQKTQKYTIDANQEANMNITHTVQ